MDPRHLTTQAEEVARTLNGLIQAVAREAGTLTKVAARLSSILIVGMGSVFSLRSAV